MHQENTGGAAGNEDRDCVAIWTFISPAFLHSVSELLEKKDFGLSTDSQISQEVMVSLQETFVEGVVVVNQTPGVYSYVVGAVCGAVYCRKLSHCLSTHTHKYHQGTVYTFPAGGLIVSGT